MSLRNWITFFAAAGATYTLAKRVKRTPWLNSRDVALANSGQAATPLAAGLQAGPQAQAQPAGNPGERLAQAGPLGARRDAAVGVAAGSGSAWPASADADTAAPGLSGFARGA